MHFLSFYTIRTIEVYEWMSNYLMFWRHFQYAMQYYLMPCALQRHVREPCNM